MLFRDYSLITCYEELEDGAWQPRRSSSFIRSLSLIYYSYLITFCLSELWIVFSFKFLTVSMDESSWCLCPRISSSFSFSFFLISSSYWITWALSSLLMLHSTGALMDAFDDYYLSPKSSSILNLILSLIIYSYLITFFRSELHNDCSAGV